MDSSSTNCVHDSCAFPRDCLRRKKEKDDDEAFDKALKDHVEELTRQRETTAESKKAFWTMTVEARNNDENRVAWKKFLRRIKYKKKQRKE